MTDNEIIRALDCCVNNVTCSEECPYYVFDKCLDQRKKDVINLINRQKVEIRTLAAERDNYKKWYFSTVEENKQIRKDFVEFSKKTMASEMLSAMNKAISALEKQLPKKPDYYDNGDYAKCPNCGNDDFEYGINNWECKHCPDCGQALDWS